MSSKVIKGFYKLSRKEKIDYIMEANNLTPDVASTLEKYLCSHSQKLFDGFSENTISNFILPYSIAPNFLINNIMYTVPMVIEESSVVAAASKAASFWAQHGGFHFQILGTEKIGQLFFEFNGSKDEASDFFDSIKDELIESIEPLQERMKKRGGGLEEFFLIEHKPHLGNIYELQATFQTADSMGANFINSCLEEMKEVLNEKLKALELGNVIMAILSNYTPNCMVRCWVECTIAELADYTNLTDGKLFAKRFSQAVHLASTDEYRATTHNKGIFNGIDAVVMATGNDFRAIEAAGHAYASQHHHYKSLTSINITEEKFKYTLEVPMALGTIGGLTTLHPLAKTSLEILGNPNANKLMGIAAAVGLANNFSAISSLITNGIQSGHMKLHLQNILHSLKATEIENDEAVDYFTNKTVSYSLVAAFLKELRKENV